MPVYASKEFKGLGFNYDPAKDPFFKALVKENLRLLSALPTGKALLQTIRDSAPTYRDKTFPAGVNVVIKPPLDRLWNTPGLGSKSGKINDQARFDEFQMGMASPNYAPGRSKLIPGIAAKTQVCESDRLAAQTKGKGSTADLLFSNNEMLSDEGNWFIPHITMGHELIHCLHACIGTMNPDNRKEEYATVGIKGYEGHAFTENALRKEAGFPLRTKYFSDD